MNKVVELAEKNLDVGKKGKKSHILEWVVNEQQTERIQLLLWKYKRNIRISFSLYFVKLNLNFLVLNLLIVELFAATH